LQETARKIVPKATKHHFIAEVAIEYMVLVFGVNLGLIAIVLWLVMH